MVCFPLQNNHVHLQLEDLFASFAPNMGKHPVRAVRSGSPAGTADPHAGAADEPTECLGQLRRCLGYG